MPVDNPFPESDAVGGYARAVVVGLIGSVPAIGSVAAAVAAERMAQAQRQRDGEWAALVNARLALLERSGVGVDPTDQRFLAACAKLFRAAQETSDRARRETLAAAAAHAGSWTSAGQDEVDEFLELAAELRTPHIALLAYFTAPEGPDGDVVMDPSERLPSTAWVEDRFGLGYDEAARLCQTLELRMLVDLPPAGDAYAADMVMRRVTPFGMRFLDFLGGHLDNQRPND